MHGTKLKLLVGLLGNMENGNVGFSKKNIYKNKDEVDGVSL